MDDRCEVGGVHGWRSVAAKELGKGRIWVSKSADRLQECGLIETQRRVRHVRVLVANIQG